MNTYSYYEGQVHRARKKLEELIVERDKALSDLPPSDWTSASEKRDLGLKNLTQLDEKIEKQEKSLLDKLGRLELSRRCVVKDINTYAEAVSELEGSVDKVFVDMARDRSLMQYSSSFESTYTVIQEKLKLASKYLNSLEKLRHKVAYEFGHEPSVSNDILVMLGTDVLEDIEGLGLKRNA